MMRHSQLNRGILLDWLKHCEETGNDFPTDERIAQRFGFLDVEQSRTLLADLADRGLITIRRTGAEREIVIGKAKPVALKKAPRPIRSVTKADPSVDRAVAKIMNIVRGTKPAASSSIPVDRRPVGEKGGEAIGRASPPGSVPYKQRKQTNVRLHHDAQDALDRLAKEQGIRSGAAAQRILEQALTVARPAPDPDPKLVPMTGKPMIRASVQRSAREAGMALPEFVTMLIDMGLDCWRDSQREAAE